jgi:(1->4)-alpha-D-glucan 1-alpha-D-glucosylmutase
MAKGVEDTAFYCFNRLAAMNEVGADPACNGLSVQRFHDYNLRMQQTHPATMTALSTHDTKRSDDVRARLLVLAEIPDEFADAIARWSKQNEKYRSDGFPDTGTEWFLYQTMIGAWPIDAERLRKYMQKAMREAKAHTSWVANNEAYEAAVAHYIDAALADENFVAELNTFVERILTAGRVNSLAQTLMKYTSPGVPDLYQGSELWDLSLVDPDNRRPVDYELRRKLLCEMKSLDARKVMQRMEDGLPKLWVVHKMLQLRNEHPEWFGAEAGYTALLASGAGAERLIAYRRGDHVLAIAPRWNQLAKEWGNTTLEIPQGKWKCRLSDAEIEGGTVRAEDLLREFPVALFVCVS